MTIGVAMILKNCSKTISRCLNSVSEFADDISIVDTGSSDNTIDICKKYTQNIHSLSWPDDFSIARNKSKSFLSTDWVLFIDGDEWLDDIGISWLSNACYDKESFSAFSLDTYNYFKEKPSIPNRVYFSKHNLLGAKYYSVSKKVRLIRNKPNFCFTYPIHEVLEPSLKQAGVDISDCPAIIHHSGYYDAQVDSTDKEKNYDKSTFYLNLLKKSKIQYPKHEKVYYDLAYQYFLLNRYNEALQELKNIEFIPLNEIGLLYVDILISLKKFELANDYFHQKNVQKIKEPMAQELLKRRSLVKINTNQIYEAIKDLRLILKLNEFDREAILALAEIYKKLGNIELSSTYRKRLSFLHDE